MLAAEGLVTMKMRRGAYVTEVNAKDLRDVFHLMAVLEADAAGTVARTATAVQLQALEAGRIEESLAEHAAIMAALTSRDAAAAQAAMRAHIESGQEAAG